MADRAPPVSSLITTVRARDAERAELVALADKQAFSGAAGDQVDAVVAAVDRLVAQYPGAAKYTSGAIL